MTKHKTITLSSKYAVRDSKKSKFIKEQEANRLLNSLGIKAPLNKIIPLIGPSLLLLAGENFMPGMHSR